MVKRDRISLVWLLVGATVLGAAGCYSNGTGAPADAPAVTVALAVGGVSTSNLQLQVSKNACATNVAQNYFKVVNGSTAAAPLSKIAIKYWIDDTGPAPITPAVWYGGCVTAPNGTCVHPVTGVTASASHFAPSCGPVGHKASWEITISTTDTTPLAAGQTWSNVQTAVNRSDYASFTPGAATWFSGCGTGQPYAADSHFAVYLDGDLVNNQGVTVPLCRAPSTVQIQSYIDRAYYKDSEIVSSFLTAQGQKIDCIDFFAQRSVQAWQAAGVAMPTSFPAAPPLPATMPPPNAAPNEAFAGQLDVNGHPQSCPAGKVPAMRPTVADIQAAGGIDAWKVASKGPRLMGAQDALQHDCWLNSAPGDGSAFNSDTAVDWEHSAGVQVSNFLPSGAAGFYGLHAITPVYAAVVGQSVASQRWPEHTDSQFWAQTGQCENWYNQAAIDSGDESKNLCAMGSACTSCTGASCNGCAVQSMEVTVFTDATATSSLQVFFTSDGYFSRSCYADGKPCAACPFAPTTVTPPGSDETLMERTDCFVIIPGAPFLPTQTLKVTGGGGAGQYGVVPNEKELAIKNASQTGQPGWWVFVDQGLVGWYPPNTFNWPDGSTGPMANGPATYLQAGGEVFDTWPNGIHTDTSMVSDNAAQTGFRFAAYNRNVGYWDSTFATLHDATLGYVVTPAAEGDNGIPGLCGLTSGAFTGTAGAPGAYTISTLSTPPGADGWGTYLYFGGGLLAKETTPPPVTVSAGALVPETALDGPDICLSFANFTPNGQVDIEYIGVPVPGVLSQVTSSFTPTVGADGRLKFEDTTFEHIVDPNCDNGQLLTTVKVIVIDISSGRSASVDLDGGLWCGNSSAPAQSGDVSGCGL